MVGCWHGYGVWGEVQIAYGPDDATATHYLLVQQIQIGTLTFLVLTFWCQITRVVPDRIQRAVKRLLL